MSQFVFRSLLLFAVLVGLPAHGKGEKDASLSPARLRGLDQPPRPIDPPRLGEQKPNAFDSVMTKLKNWVNVNVSTPPPPPAPAEQKKVSQEKPTEGPKEAPKPESKQAADAHSDHGHSHGGGGGGGEGGVPDPTANLASPPKQVIRQAGGATAFSFWYPMCLFIDPDATDEATAKKTIKDLIDDAADCGVNLVINARTLDPASYPNGDPEEINRLQTAACDLQGKIGNATRASTSICVNDDQTADKMCKSMEPDPNNPGRMRYTTNVAGCAQVNSSPEEAAVVEAYKAQLRQSKKAVDQERLREIEDHMKGGASSSPIAPSIEDRGQCTGRNVGHEAVGHSGFGHPNGGSDGQGIGLGKEGGGNGWSAQGCAAMRRNSFANNGQWMWDPAETDYYTEIRDPSLRFNLRSDRVMAAQREAPPARGDEGELAAVPAPGGAPAAEGNSDSAVAQSVGPGSRHRGVPGGSGGGGNYRVGGARGNDLRDPIDQFVNNVNAGPARTKDSVEFDDSIGKGGKEARGLAGERRPLTINEGDTTGVVGGPRPSSEDK